MSSGEELDVGGKLGWETGLLVVRENRHVCTVIYHALFKRGGLVVDRVLKWDTETLS